jgi:hypothetical protein
MIEDMCRLYRKAVEADKSGASLDVSQEESKESISRRRPQLMRRRRKVERLRLKVMRTESTVVQL